MNAALVFVPIMNVSHGLAPRNMNLAIATRNAALAFVPELMSVGHFKSLGHNLLRCEMIQFIRGSFNLILVILVK